MTLAHRQPGTLTRPLSNAFHLTAEQTEGRRVALKAPCLPCRAAMLEDVEPDEPREAVKTTPVAISLSASTFPTDGAAAVSVIKTGQTRWRASQRWSGRKIPERSPGLEKAPVDPKDVNESFPGPQSLDVLAPLELHIHDPRPLDVTRSFLRWNMVMMCRQALTTAPGGTRGYPHEYQLPLASRGKRHDDRTMETSRLPARTW